MSLDEPSPPPSNDKHYSARSYAWIAAVVLTPLVSILGSIAASYYTFQSSIAESNAEYARLAVEVLNSKDTDEHLKAWAVTALGAYSGIDVPEPEVPIVVEDIKRHGLSGGENSTTKEIIQGVCSTGPLYPFC